MDSSDLIRAAAAVAAGLSGFLARRRIGSAWRTAYSVWDANRRVANLETERDDLRRALTAARDQVAYLTAALTEITAAAAHVKAAHDAGRLQIGNPSADLPSARDDSPAISTASPTKPSRAPTR